MLVFVLLSTGAFAAVGELNKLAIETEVQALSKEFASGSILSKQFAEAALTKIDILQINLQNELQEKESGCLENFFTNTCLQEVRLKRRELQEILRNIRIEAKSFLRGKRANKSTSINDQN